MVGMGLRVEGGALALALVVASGSALGAPKCAKHDEVTAIQAAAIQQQLMVAALTCNEIANFNQFQTSFSGELRRADASLQHMFHRLFGGGKGEAEYHAFKTRLANNSSIRSIHDNTGYCHDAGAAFEAALAPVKPTLESFVAGVGVTESGPVDSCDMNVAVGFSGAIPNVVPRPNPLRLAILTAPQAGAMSSTATTAAPASAATLPAPAANN